MMCSSSQTRPCDDVSGHLPPRDAIEALTWIMVSAFRGWDATPPTVGEFREAFIGAVRQAMETPDA